VVSFKCFPALWTNKNEGARIAAIKVTDMLRAVDLDHIDIYIDALVFAILKSSAEVWTKRLFLSPHSTTWLGSKGPTLIEHHRQTLFS
jgi:hypothetical protein